MILMVLFYTKAFIEKHAALDPKPVLSVYGAFGTEVILPMLPFSNILTFMAATKKWHIFHVTCEENDQMTNKQAISAQTAMHDECWLGQYE